MAREWTERHILELIRRELKKLKSTGGDLIDYISWDAVTSRLSYNDGTNHRPQYLSNFNILGKEEYTDEYEHVSSYYILESEMEMSETEYLMVSGQRVFFYRYGDADYFPIVTNRFEATIRTTGYQDWLLKMDDVVGPYIFQPGDGTEENPDRNFGLYNLSASIGGGSVTGATNQDGTSVTLYGTPMEYMFYMESDKTEESDYIITYDSWDDFKWWVDSGEDYDDVNKTQKIRVRFKVPVVVE